MIAAAPHRSRRVNDKPGRKTMALSFTALASGPWAPWDSMENQSETLVICFVQRRRGEQGWTNLRSSLLALPIEIHAVDQQLAEAAGEIKATKKMSLVVDCFAAALSKKLKAELYTGDPEFGEVESEGKVVWLV